MFRKIVSLTALFSFVVTILTSLILYIAPQGRVAYWSDWKLWGLDKTQWGNLHITIGTLFVLALIIHAFYNWNPIVAYLSKKRQMVFFTKECLISLLVLVVVGLGTSLSLPPFSSFLNLSEQLKDAAAVKYGEPPYGHAELSTLKSLASKIGLTPEGILDSLTKAGYAAENAEETLVALARRYGVSPQRIYAAFAPAAQPGQELPPSPPAGTGLSPLADLCNRYGLKIPEVLRALAAKGITAKADMTIKKIAEDNKTSPQDVYGIIRDAFTPQPADKKAK